MVIAILAALLLPALSRAKDRARTLACNTNLKSLTFCFHLYTGDNNDYLVPNNSVVNISSSGPIGSEIQGASWLPDQSAPTELDPSNIVNGLLYNYNRSLAIYHCPADNSTLETEDGQPLPKPRWRSYNMSQSVNGYPSFDPTFAMLIPSWTKYTQIRHPVPSDFFVLTDEHEDTILDAQFGNPPQNSPYYQADVWWDLPANRHNQGPMFPLRTGMWSTGTGACPKFSPVITCKALPRPNGRFSGACKPP